MNRFLSIPIGTIEYVIVIVYCLWLQESDMSKLTVTERRELLYGPGGVFGPRGPFSTPGTSRYPEPVMHRRKQEQGKVLFVIKYV